MNDTMLIEITNRKAVRLLRELEELHLIKVLREDTVPIKAKLSDKYAGKLPADVANELQDYVKQSRNEWNKSNI